MAQANQHQVDNVSEFTQCIGCKQNLLYKPLEDWVGSTNLDLPYCPNAECVRYGLFTLEADELVNDLVPPDSEANTNLSEESTGQPKENT